MRVISMQSKVVWDIVQREGRYLADITKCRELALYEEERKTLNGKVPIWCFYYPEFSFVTMYNNELLEELRCEMSLGQENCWDSFYMFELEIPSELLFRGIHHNANARCLVFGELLLSYIQAVYEINDSATNGWYFKVLNPIFYRDNNVITTTRLDCAEWDSIEDSYTGCFTKGDHGKCLVCGRDTSFIWLNKHYCCLAHLWKHKQRLIRSAAMHGENQEKAVEIYNYSSDLDYIKENRQ